MLLSAQSLLGVAGIPLLAWLLCENRAALPFASALRFALPGVAVQARAPRDHAVSSLESGEVGASGEHPGTAEGQRARAHVGGRSRYTTSDLLIDMGTSSS